jgi:hypothetical protein
MVVTHGVHILFHFNIISQAMQNKLLKFVVGIIKAVTNIGKHFHRKTPIWFQVLTKYWQYNCEISLMIAP